MSMSVSLRTTFFNLFRYFFKIPLLESFLLSRILDRPANIFRKLIPPLHLYRPGKLRFVEREHLKYALDISRLLDHSIFFGIVNDPSWRNLLQCLSRDTVIVDAGANIGYLTLQFARACPDGFVYAFEPDSDNYRDLERNMGLNYFRNVKTYHVALGAKSGKETLYKIYPRNPGTNRILPAVPAGSYTSEMVKVATLDEVVEQTGISRIDLWKIDVEGYEMAALQGGITSIKKWKPTLFVELVDANLRQHGLTSLAVIEYIDSLDYEVLDARRMIPIDRSKSDHNTDIICFSRPTSGF